VTFNMTELFREASFSKALEIVADFTDSDNDVPLRPILEGSKQCDRRY
jgi:hypothetical protein